MIRLLEAGSKLDIELQTEFGKCSVVVSPAVANKVFKCLTNFNGFNDGREMGLKAVKDGKIRVGEIR